MHWSLAALACVAASTAQDPLAPDRGILREIRINAEDVFSTEVAGRRPLAALVNALHWQTREDTVAREFWVAPGEVITAAQAAELERNLRALGLFAEVTARLVPTGRVGYVDLEVNTRDRLTLNASASASTVGNVTSYRASIGESNLFGRGDRINASFSENTDGEFRGSMVYTDLHVLDTWHTGSARITRTDDGNEFAIEVLRPIKHLADPFGYGGAVDLQETAVEYFRAGDSAAKIPLQRTRLGGDMTWVRGPTNSRDFQGFFASMQHISYEPAEGLLAPSFRVPGSTRTLLFGGEFRHEEITGFRKVTNLDTLDFVQDLQLGWSYGGSLGVQWREESTAGSSLQPVATLAADWTYEPLPMVFLRVAGRHSGRWNGDDIVGRQTQIGFWGMAAITPTDTLASSIVFDSVRERQDLPQELTLGVDNGLRGYAARLLHGDSRLRSNLEWRHDTGFELATVRVGLVAFTDLGWIGELADLGQAYAGAGVGLRFGSRALFGSSVLRIDLARALIDVPEHSSGWQVSVTVGQMFTFGSNASVLGAR